MSCPSRLSPPPAMKRTFNAGVLIYVLFFMVLYHGYLEKETPVVTVKCAFSHALFGARACARAADAGAAC